jgi:hypothetical protein
MALERPIVRLSDMVRVATSLVRDRIPAVKNGPNGYSFPQSLAHRIDVFFRERLDGGLRPFLERAQGIDFTQSSSLISRRLQNFFGPEHTAYNILGLAQTTADIATALVHYAAMVGVKKFWEEYQAVGNSLDRLAVHRDFAHYGPLHYRRWIENYAKIHGMKLSFESAELVPQDGPVIYAVFCHSSIYPDFFLPYLDPRAAYVADAYNFRDNSLSRKIGFSLIGDLSGQPLVDRKDGVRSDKLFKHIVDVAAEYGVRPVWFPNGGRVPRAWKEDGTLDRAGFYSSVPKLNDFKKYLQSIGVAKNAVHLAKKMGQTVKVVVVTIQGPEFIMPKSVQKPPFIQPTRIRREIIHRFVDVFNVDPTASPNQVTASLGRNLHVQAKKDLGIDDYLIQCVEQWGEAKGLSGRGEVFANRAKVVKDEILFIIADRIRSIHPSLPQRGELIEKLFNLLESSEQNGPFGALLEEVTTVMLAHQFDSF